MRAAAVLPSLLIALLASAAFAQAGTEADPEVKDAGDDGTSPVPGADIVSFWVDDALGATSDGKPALALHLAIAGDINHRPALFAFGERFRVSFTSSSAASMQGAAELYVHVSPSNPSESVVVTSVPNPSEESVSCRFGRAAAAGASADIPLEVTLEALFPSGSHFGCLLPVETLAAATGDKLSGFVVRQQLVSRGPLSGGDDVPVTVLQTFDTAPDSGAGRDYIVAGLPTAAVATAYHNLTGTTVSNTTRFTQATSATQYNWTSSLANGTVVLSAQGSNGTLSVVILDAANATVARQVFAPSGNLSQAFKAATPGAWRILVNATSYTGNLTFTVGPPGTTSSSGPSPSAPGSPGSGTTTGTGTAAGTGTGTASGSTTGDGGKGAPGLGLVASLAVVAVALAARRRA